MKLARTSPEAIAALHTFLARLETLLEGGYFVDDDGEEVQVGGAGADSILDEIHEQHRGISLTWERSIWNLDTLYRCCCDHELPHLDHPAHLRDLAEILMQPEVLLAIPLAERLRISELLHTGPAPLVKPPADDSATTPGGA